MMQWALIVDGRVTELTDTDPTERFHPDMVWAKAPAKVREGWSYDGKTFAPPATSDEPAPVPATVTMRQARISLSRADLLSKAEAAIAVMEGQAGEEARIEWEYAAELKRDHPLIAALGQALGLSSDAVDDLFREAAVI